MDLVFRKLFSLSTLVFITYSNDSNSHILEYQELYSRFAPAHTNETDGYVTFSRSCDQGKITKKIER